MNKSALVLENSEGKVSRYIDWAGKGVFVVFRNDTRRVDFVENIDWLKDQKISFECLHEVSASQLMQCGVNKPFKIGMNTQLRLVDKNEKDLVVSNDVEFSEEDKKTFPLYMKYATVSHVATLVCIFTASWLINRYISQKVEPVIVQVFEQKREDIVRQQVTVNVSKRKLNKKVYLKNKSVNYAKAHSSSKLQRRSGMQVSNGISNRGALGALGGMGRQYRGSGGLNLKNIHDNSGIGYGGPAARGGADRGLIGKGLVAAGIGRGGSLQGYNGKAGHGLGGGRPGYSSINGAGMAGSAGAYFVPLREDSLVGGGLDQDQINAVVQSHIGQVLNCYEQGLQSKPGLSGRVSVNFIINGNGRVDTARIANTSVDSKKVENCIVTKLRGWKFPRPIGQVNVRVTYPFVLKRLSQS